MKKVVLGGWMDGWIDGWMDGWAHAWMGGYESRFKDCLQPQK